MWVWVISVAVTIELLGFLSWLSIPGVDLRFRPERIAEEREQAEPQMVGPGGLPNDEQEGEVE
jgi:hypothetical protein